MQDHFASSSDRDEKERRSRAENSFLSLKQSSQAVPVRVTHGHALSRGRAIFVAAEMLGASFAGSAAFFVFFQSPVPCP